MYYPIGTLYAFPQPVPQNLGEGMSTLAYMTAAALPGALATGTSTTIAARMAFEAACLACDLLDQAQIRGGDPLDVVRAAPRNQP